MGGPVKNSQAMATQRPTPRPSLAATHPANYAQAPAPTQCMPPPPSKVKKPKECNAERGSASKVASDYPTPSPSPPTFVAESFDAATGLKQPRQASQAQRILPLPFESRKRAFTNAQYRDRLGRKALMPWEEHTDPTFTASDVPPYWYRNHTVMKADTDLTHGAVTSPTFMHGLPFGTMIEAAHHYPSEDGLGQLQ